MTVGDAAVLRMAAALDDYDLLRVEKVWSSGGGRIFEIVVHDLRFDASYRITSRSDYWDFLARFIDHSEWSPGRVQAARSRAS